MKVQTFPAALMMAGLLMTVAVVATGPALAQTTTVQKQKTQDGPDSAFWQENNTKYNQKTQDGPDSAFWQETNTKNKQHTQNLTHTEPTAAMVTPK